MDERFKPRAPGRGALAAEQGESTAPSVQPNPAEVKPRPVSIRCDGCGIEFSKPITEVLNRFTVPCPECKWPAWTPRDCWPFEPHGGPLRPTIGARP